MKTLSVITLLIVFALNTLKAQVPHSFNYQAVARNSGGLILSNQLIGLKVNILQGSSSGTIVYSESHSITSNANGLINAAIGSGTVLQGTFSAITWSTGVYYMEISMDASGGTNYTLMGTQQLLSSPYALYAETSGSSIPGPQGPQGDPGPAGTYTAGTGISIAGGIIKTNLNNVTYSFSNSVSSNARNTVVSSSEYLTIPSSGLYLLMYDGTGANSNQYVGFSIPAYDLLGKVGLINLTQNPALFLNGNSQNMYTTYSYSDASSGNNYRYSPLTQSIFVVVYCNAGDHIGVGGIVFTSGSPDPTGNWSMGPRRIEAIKLKD